MRKTTLVKITFFTKLIMGPYGRQTSKISSLTLLNTKIEKCLGMCVCAYVRLCVHVRMCVCAVAYPGGFSGCPETPPPAMIFFKSGDDTVTCTDLHHQLKCASFGNPP